MRLIRWEIFLAWDKGNNGLKCSDEDSTVTKMEKSGLSELILD